MAAITARPVVLGVFITCVSVGAVLGGLLLTDEWSLVRRIAAGVVAGAGVGLLITAPKVIG